MSKNLLRLLFFRNREFVGLVRQIATATGAQVWVEDNNGELLFGERQSYADRTEAISAFGEVLGYASGCEKATLFAELLSQWVAKEAAQKKMGAEVLHLYREINLIFGFSEKLASVVGLKPIASLALSEVGRLIPFDQGMIVYKPAPQSPGRILAHAGAPLEWKDASIPGSSEIIPLEGGGWAMFAALKVKFNVLGTLLIVRNKGGEFSAEDLKLLTSLALQSASAMESSIHYEQAAARALEEQRGQLTLDLALRNPFFRKVAAIVENRFSDPGFGVEQLSQALNMSPSQVQRKIMALTKKTPLQIIRGARMKKARELLQKTDLSVAEVAFRSGFADPSYFTRMFSKEEGAPPSLWKDNQAT